jgi:hypothetical protein
MAALILRALVAASIAAAAASSSSLAVPPPEPEPAAQFLPVAGCQIVLTAPVHDDWATGAPRARPGEYGGMPNAIVRDVDEGRIPRSLAAWRGARVKLFDVKGPLGEATIQDLAVLDRFDEVAGDDGSEGGWVVVDGALVGQLKADDASACARAVWARPAAAPVPEITPARPARGALRAAALRAFRALPASRRLDAASRRWMRDHGGPPRFDLAMPWYNRGVTINILPPTVPGGPTLVAVAARTQGLCNEPEGSLWALWEVVSTTRPGDPPVLVPRSRPRNGLYLVPAATVDVNGDGVPEILYQDLRDRIHSNAAGQPAMEDIGILRRGARLYDQHDGLTVMTFVCPC